MAQASAGWYPDPSGAPGQRYFDGTTWTQWSCTAEQLGMGLVSIKSTSPGGRYIVCVDPFEARAFQWVETPELFDAAAGRALLALTDRYWHLDSADWRSESVVVGLPNKVPALSDSSAT
jgi:hypothetical protein